MTREELIKKKKEEIATLEEMNEICHQNILDNDLQLTLLQEELFKLESEMFNPIGKCYKYVDTHYGNKYGNGAARVVYVHITNKCDYGDMECVWKCEELQYRHKDKKLEKFSYDYETNEVIFPDLTSKMCWNADEKVTEVSVDEFEHVKSYFMSGNPPRTIDDIVL